MIYSKNTSIILICIAAFLSICHRGVLCDIYSMDDSAAWLKNITVKNVEEAIYYGARYNDIYVSSSENIIRLNGIYVKPGTSSFKQLIDSKPSNIDGIKIHRKVEMLNVASDYIVETYCLNHGNNEIQCAMDLENLQLDYGTIEGVCVSDNYYSDTQCQKVDMKYRTADGFCNNLKHYLLGKLNTAYKRLLFPSYTDGLSLFSDNPNARKLSTNLVNTSQKLDSQKTIAMAFWSIFIGHDLSRTVVSSMLYQDIPVECCRQNGFVQYPVDRHPKCTPVIIPDDDSFFSSRSKYYRCMNYVRSATTFRTDCTFGPIEQINEATHYLDASMLYGSDEAHTLKLRRQIGGELLSFRSNYTGDEMYLPFSHRPDECSTGDAHCFEAGDTRVNSLPHLTVMYTLWLREHNRVARQLSTMNCHWNDERVFQETRKIIIACVQHITYNEWLPSLLGGSLGGTQKHRESLQPLSYGYSKLYDVDVNPAVSNSFATAILPFAYSMLSGQMILYSENRTMENVLSLKDAYTKPVEKLITSPGFFSGFIRGLAMQNTEEVDMHFTEVVTNYLYHNQSVNNSFGMDIVSLTIQRSRDHGIPSYIQFRKYCGFDDIYSIKDLNKIMVEGAADKLFAEFNYKSLDEIDLFIGVLFEMHIDDSMVGPTMSCIIREQFIRTRLGDRYFYDLPNIFNENQLNEIRKITLARIFCSNGGDILKMQQNVFHVPRFLTEKLRTDLQECTSIPSINLNYWKEYIVATRM